MGWLVKSAQKLIAQDQVLAIDRHQPDLDQRLCRRAPVW